MKLRLSKEMLPVIKLMMRKVSSSDSRNKDTAALSDLKTGANLKLPENVLSSCQIQQKFLV